MITRHTYKQLQTLRQSNKYMSSNSSRNGSRIGSPLRSKHVNITSCKKTRSKGDVEMFQEPYQSYSKRAMAGGKEPKQKFTIFQDALDDASMAAEEVDLVELEDKENEVSKENLKPSNMMELLNSDNLANNKILDKQIDARNPLSSKSIVLYPGFLEIGAELVGGSGMAAGLENMECNFEGSESRVLKPRVLHLPKKSSPLKPTDASLQLNTPKRFGTKLQGTSPQVLGRDSINRKSTAIFGSPVSSPIKSKLTNKLLTLAGKDEASSNESLYSAGSRERSSMFGIPSLSNFSEKKKVFKDAEKRSKSSDSSSISLYSDYEESVSTSNGSSDEFRRIRRLDQLWEGDRNAAGKDSDTKKYANEVLKNKLPSYVTPPRMIKKELLKTILESSVKKPGLTRSASDRNISRAGKKLIEEKLKRTISNNKNVVEDTHSMNYGKGVDDGYRDTNQGVVVDGSKIGFMIFQDQ